MATTNPDTDLLLDRAAAGDGRARQELLARHRKRLRRMVALRLDRRLAARVDPSDVVQEALADAARKLDGYLRDRPLPFYPWLRQLAGERLVADANTGWTQHEAMRVVAAVRDVDVYIEQPCLTYEECLAVRRHTDHPFVLDETIDSLEMLLRARNDLAMDVVNLKISKLGGLTRTTQVRDLCVSMGIAMTLEDSWGGDIVTAAIAHLAHSTPSEFLFTATDFNSYVTVSIADGAPRRVNGRMAASTGGTNG